MSTCSQWKRGRAYALTFVRIRCAAGYAEPGVWAEVSVAGRQFAGGRAVGSCRRALEARKAELQGRKKALDDEMARLGGRRFALLDRRIATAEAGSKEPSRPEMGWHSPIQSSPDGVQWVQVDLGQPVEIHRVLYAGCHDDFNGIGKGFGFPPRYRVELSDDAEFKTGVRSLEDQMAADLPNPGTTPREVSVPGLRGRYVRFTATRLAHRMKDYIFALSEV